MWFASDESIAPSSLVFSRVSRHRRSRVRCIRNTVLVLNQPTRFNSGISIHTVFLLSAATSLSKLGHSLSRDRELASRRDLFWTRVARHQRCRVRSIRNTELAFNQPTSVNNEISIHSGFLVPAAPSFCEARPPVSAEPVVLVGRCPRKSRRTHCRAWPHSRRGGVRVRKPRN